MRSAVFKSLTVQGTRRASSGHDRASNGHHRASNGHHHAAPMRKGRAPAWETRPSHDCDVARLDLLWLRLRLWLGLLARLE